MEYALATHSLLFAKAYGLYFIVVGIGLLSSPDRFRSWYEDIVSESRRVLFGGTIALIIGCFIIATHHHIVLGWPLLITLIGYWGILAGLGCYISDNFIKLFKPMINSSDLIYRLSGLAWALIGLFLAYQGFII
tara:strand:+ start:43 stop:444 length:402 start_codon:yes stop_codon:yes gene_type:complete